MLVCAENESQWSWWVSSTCEEGGSPTCPCWSNAEAMEIYCSSGPCHHQCSCWFQYHWWSSCFDCWKWRVSTASEDSRASLCLSKQNLLSACKQLCYIRLAFLSSVSCRALQTFIPALYHKVKLLQKQALHDHFPSLTNRLASGSSSNQSSILSCPNPHHPVSFTTDMWTGPDHESYICLTAHWLTPDWQLHHALLDILLCTDRHTGENLVEWIKQVLRANDFA